MKNNKAILGILFFLLLAATGALFIIEENTIALFCGIFALFVGALFAKSIVSNSSPEKVYESTVNNILKTYEVILVEIENLPEFEDRKIVQTQSFDDLVNIEYEYRKPVYFIHNEYSYDFMLMTDDELYAYTLKLNEEKRSQFEKYLDDKARASESSSKQLDVIDSIDNTVVIKVGDGKEFVISPIKPEESKTPNVQVIDNTDGEQKEELNLKDITSIEKENMSSDADKESEEKDDTNKENVNEEIKEKNDEIVDKSNESEGSLEDRKDTESDDVKQNV